MTRTAHVEPLRLHYNENTAGCSPAVLDALRAMTREEVGRYPDIGDLTRQVERWFGVGTGGALVTNGLDEGLQIVAQCGAWHYYGEPRPERVDIVVVEPAFEVYEACAVGVGASLVRIAPLPDFRFPLAELIAAVTPSTRAIYLTDPNNPTGLGIPAGAVEAIATAAPHALLLVDEAYADFSGRTLIGPLLDRHRNLVVGRTFAKAQGLAALRIGALVAHPDTLDRFRRIQLPFSVNICAITALAAALADRSYLDWYVGEVRASRTLVYDFCRARGITCWPSEANFVLMRIGPDAPAVTAALAARGVLVRDKHTSPGCAGCIRLTTGVVAHTRQALAALEDILASRTR